MKSIYYILLTLGIISGLVVLAYYAGFIPLQIEGDVRNGQCTSQKDGKYEYYLSGEWKTYTFNCENLNSVVPYCQEPTASDKTPTCDDVCTNQYCGDGNGGTCEITAVSCYNECIENREGHEVKCMEGNCPFLWTNIGDYGCSDFSPCTKCCCDLITPCSCGNWIEQGCNVNPCAPGHRTYTRTCAPSGCTQEFRCEIDSSCPSGECDSVDWIDPVECSPSNNLAGSRCHGEKIISCDLYDGPVYCWTLVEDCETFGRVCIDDGTVDKHDTKCSGDIQLPWSYILAGVFGLIGFLVPTYSVKKRKRSKGMVIGLILGLILVLACYWIFTYYIDLNEMLSSIQMVMR